MTKKEIIARLVEAGIDHNPKQTKAELAELLANRETEENEGKAPKRSKAEQLARYKERYEPYVTETGTSMDNGDEVAKLLRGSDAILVMRAAEILKEMPEGELAERYADRNPGAKRMNAGNIIRGCIRRGDKTPKDIEKALKAASKTVNAAA